MEHAMIRVAIIHEGGEHEYGKFYAPIYELKRVDGQAKWVWKYEYVEKISHNGYWGRRLFHDRKDIIVLADELGLPCLLGFMLPSNYIPYEQCPLEKALPVPVKND